MPTFRRSRKAYDTLYDNPNSLFGTAETYIWRDGIPEIQIRSRDGKRGVRISASDTIAGLSIEVIPLSSTDPITLYPGVEADHIIQGDTGLPLVDEVQHMTVTQYRPDTRPVSLAAKRLEQRKRSHHRHTSKPESDAQTSMA